MAVGGEVEADFGGEARAFVLRLGELRSIEDKCGAGVGEVVRRLARAVLALSRAKGLDAYAIGLEIHVDDVREPIYRGLVRGGMPPGDATKLVRIEIDDRGLQGALDNVGVALQVLTGSQSRPKGQDGDLGEPQAGPNETPPNE